MKPKGNATLTYGDGKSVDLPVFSGTHGPDVIDIRKLYAQTGMFTYDPGFMSTSSCNSTITYIDGDKGELLYRGYPIEQLATKCDFMDNIPRQQHHAVAVMALEIGFDQMAGDIVDLGGRAAAGLQDHPHHLVEPLRRDLHFSFDSHAGRDTRHPGGQDAPGKAAAPSRPLDARRFLG